MLADNFFYRAVHLFPVPLPLFLSVSAPLDAQVFHLLLSLLMATFFFSATRWYRSPRRPPRTAQNWSRAGCNARQAPRALMYNDWSAPGRRAAASW